jgi:hypothetical protein
MCLLFQVLNPARRKAKRLIIATAVTAHHHLDPRFAAITGSTIVANGTSQKKGPILSKTGSRPFMDFGASINSHMNTMQPIAIHPRELRHRRLSATVNGDKNTSRDYHRSETRKKKPLAATDAPVEAHDCA